MDDIRGVPVSCSEPGALAGFEQALLAFQTYNGDAGEILAPYLAQTPSFVTGHLFHAIALYLVSERRFALEAQDALAAARRHAASANSRELALMRAVELLVAGDWDAACGAFDNVLVDYPRDALALQSAHLMDFFRGDALNLRNRLQRVLPHWSPTTPGYSYTQGMLAFGLEECNEYDAAEAAALAAIEIDPGDAWAIHAATHVYEMRGQIDHGIKFLEQRVSDWGGDNALSYHNAWHLGLLHLDNGNVDRTLEILDADITPEVGDFSIGMLDGTSMLWRFKLLGLDVGERFEAAADGWTDKLDRELGHYAFNDFHAALAFAATGRAEELERVQRGMAEAADNGQPSNRMMAKTVGLGLVQAITDYAEERFIDSANKLALLRDTCRIFGGSHAQRDVVTLTLISAARRAGMNRLADHYLSERTGIKPMSYIARRLGSLSQ